MSLSFLKKIRVAVSLLFLLATLSLFFDLTQSVVSIIAEPVLYLQFIPSLFKVFAKAGIYSLGFVIVIVLTTLFGRVYCSTVCPLGIMQDVISWFSKKINKKKKFKFSKEYFFLRNGIMILTIVSVFAGTMLLINLLDPYSNFGRIAAQLFRPIYIFGNNLVSAVLEMFNSYTVSPLDYKSIRLELLVFPVTIFFVIAFMSYKHGRLYCNTICPLGSWLGALSKISVFRISIEDDKCKSCGACEKVCKAECINSKEKTIDVSRCVDCFNCLTVCPSSGVTITNYYKKSNKKADETNFSESKRKFVKDVSMFVLGSSAIVKAQEKIKSYKENKVPTNKKHYATPPGSLSHEHFTSFCTACNLCVSVCPTNVLQPSFLEYGMLGILQPYLENHKGFCNFECNLCSTVCPSGAILPILLEKKKATQLGVAHFIQENCIVYTEKTDCGACSEHCPTKAVKMEPHGNLVAPKVYEEYCIGCGACEYACPTKPHKAIYVEGNIVHKKAKKPVVEKVNTPTPAEDFPF